MIEMIDIGIENTTAFRMSGKLTESDVSLVLSDTAALGIGGGNIKEVCRRTSGWSDLPLLRSPRLTGT